MVRIDLITPELRCLREGKVRCEQLRRVIWLIVALVVLVVAPIPFDSRPLQSEQLGLLRREVSELEAQKKAATEAARRQQQWRLSIARYDSMQSQLVQLLGAFSTINQADFSLTELQSESDGVTVRGYARHATVVSELVARISRDCMHAVVTIEAINAALIARDEIVAFVFRVSAQVEEGQSAPSLRCTTLQGLPDER